MGRWRSLLSVWHRLHRLSLVVARALGIARPTVPSPWALGQTDCSLVNSVWDSRAKRRAPQQVLVTLRNEPITRAVMFRMRPREWLNDELVNGYLGLVVDLASQRDKRCHAMSSFFYAKLASHGYDGVCRWTRTVDLRACSLVLFPINLGDEHWILASLDVSRRHLDVWDSFRKRHPSIVRALRRYLADEWSDKYAERLEPEAWSCSFRQDAPLQLNGYDCGVCLCTTARCLLLGGPVDFRLEHASDIRRWMSIEMLQSAIRLREGE